MSFNNFFKNVGYMLLVPAAWGTFQAVRKKKPGDKVIFGGVAAVSLLLFFKTQRKEQPINVPDIDIPDPTGVSIPFVETMVSRLEEAFKWYNVADRCDALQQYSETDDNNFIAIANLFKNRYNMTIRQVIDQTISGCINPFNNAEDVVRERLIELNVP